MFWRRPHRRTHETCKFRDYRSRDSPYGANKLTSFGIFVVLGVRHPENGFISVKFRRSYSWGTGPIWQTYRRPMSWKSR